MDEEEFSRNLYDKFRRVGIEDDIRAKITE